MRTLRFTLSSGALLLASFILFISLSASNSRMVTTHSTFESSHRQFYISQTILPDHVAYPILMAFDKAKLETAAQDKQLYLEVEYAQRRFEYAQDLLKRDNQNLALTTITKALKYSLQAGIAALDTDVSAQDKQFVLRHLQAFIQTVPQLKPAFTDADYSVVEHHLQELQVIQNQLSIQVIANS